MQKNSNKAKREVYNFGTKLEQKNRQNQIGKKAKNKFWVTTEKNLARKKHKLLDIVSRHTKNKEIDVINFEIVKKTYESERKNYFPR